MNPIYSQIYLDLQHKAIESVNLKQYDYESRYIRFRITDNGNPYILTSDVQANIKIQKPDGTKVVHTAAVDVDSNEITASVTGQMTAAYGVLYADLTLFRDNQVISTMPFHIHIERSPVQNEDIVSADEYGALEDLISDVQKTEALRQANEQARLAAEEIRSAHEEQRTEAEALRGENEAVRITAENTRTVNEQSRVSNESARQEQEALRQEQTSAAIANAKAAAQDAATAADDLQNKLDNHHFVLTADKNIADGVPGLDANAKIPVAELYEATTSGKGITQLTDSTTSTSTTTAATPNSVKTAYDASKAYTDAKVADLINGAPSTLDTLGEIADAMAENQTVVEALDAAIGTKISAITGDPYIGASKSGTVVTVFHENVTRTSSASAVSPAPGGTFTAVKSVASDSKGHVTAVDTETVTLPVYEAATSSNDGLMSASDKVRLDELVTGTNTTYSLSKSGSTITLTGSDGSTTSVTDSDTNTWRGIQDNLTSTSTTDSLSAAQGKVLNDRITTLNNGVNLKTYTALSQIGLSGIPTAAEVYAAMPDGSALQIEGSLISDYPADMSTINFYKISNMRGYATAHNKGNTTYTMYLTANGGLDGKWVTTLDESNYKTYCTPANIGAAASSHTHDDLPLSGGTMTGNLKITDGLSIGWAGGAYLQSRGGQELFIAASNEADYRLFFGVESGSWTLCPRVNGNLLLGLPGKKWGQIYSTVSAISTSDRNQKKDIHSLSEKYTALFTLLQPVSYRFIDGTSGRTHIGFISQDVEEAMEQVGLTDLEFAGFCKDIMTDKDTGESVLDENGNPVYIYSLRYEEFIALNTAVIQNQQQQISLLKESLEKLEKTVESLSQKS